MSLPSFFRPPSPRLVAPLIRRRATSATPADLRRLFRSNALAALAVLASVILTGSVAAGHQTSFQPSSDLHIFDDSMQVMALPEALRTDSPDALVIRGWLRSTGDGRTGLVRVVATFHDSSGQVVASAAGFPTAGFLRPGQDVPFQVVTSPNPRIASYALTVEEARRHRAARG